MHSDWPLEQLREYRPDLLVPPDLDAFWAETLATACVGTRRTSEWTPGCSPWRRTTSR